MKKKLFVIFTTLICLLAACSSNDQKKETSTSSDLEKVSFVLDWTPNTNHTGIYVAQEKGFFEEEGLDVEIMLPGEVGSTQLIATGNADFGVSYQEGMMMARSEGMPIVSIAAIIQHNTAGYASPVEKGITEPKDFEGKTFGGVGSDLERAMMETIMRENDADIDTVEFKNIGDADYFVAVERDVDFSLVYQGWTGIEADIRDKPQNMVYLKDFAEALDFYTPILATNETHIKDNPELVEKFVRAARKGYVFAIENPGEAANILIDHEPDLDPELVKQSQEWLSTQYQDDAPQFGIQEKDRWQMVNDFMVEHGILENPLEIEKAFTNQFITAKKGE